MILSVNLINFGRQVDIETSYFIMSLNCNLLELDLLKQTFNPSSILITFIEL